MFALGPADVVGLVRESQEPPDAQVLAVLVEGAREYEMQVGDPGAGDPVLAPVDDVAVAVLLGPGAHRGGVTAGVGLGDADGGLVAGDDQLGGQLPLLLGAVLHDRGNSTHVGLDGDSGGHGALASQLLDDQARLQQGTPLPAVCPREGHPHEAGRGHLSDDVPRVLAVAVDPGGDRPYDLVCEPSGPRL